MSNALDPADPPVVPESSVAPKTARPAIVGQALLLDLFLIGLWVGVTDLLLYHVGTFLAWGLFLIGAVLFFALTKRSCGHVATCLAVASLMIGMGLKLAWCGSWLQVVCGVFLVFCYAMAFTGVPPFLPEVIGFFAYVVTGAAERISRFRISSVTHATGAVRPVLGVQFLLPAAVVLAFAFLFMLANPDVVERVTTQIRLAWDTMGRLLTGIEFFEVTFCVLSGWLILGLLYPARHWMWREQTPKEVTQAADTAPLFLAYRNTLWSVIGLFALYLVFEFSTLWFRTFPENFYYAGYAHQGAFWLTVALGLATLVLSIVFQGDVLRDPRLRTLKRLAILWSVENLVLSAAVYNRLFIYIDFNGMTRMRVVGLLGITAVVAGFGLVVVKILHTRGVVWLLHRQLWVPVLALIAYAALPVDWLVQRYNTRLVLSQNPAPAVQIAAHRTSAEGVLPLTDLVDVEDEVIRDGVRALLALWAEELGVVPANPAETSTEEAVTAWRSEYGHSTPWLQSRYRRRQATAEAAGWLGFQGAEYLLKHELEELEPKWREFGQSSARRREALNNFFRYTYQWY